MSLSLLPVRTSSSPPSVACRASKKADGATGNAKKKGGDYQEAWFKSTRATLDAQSTTEGRRRVIREYVEANRKANGGREREDLYTDNWDGAFRRSSVVGRRSSVVMPDLEPRRAPPSPSPSLTHTHTLRFARSISRRRLQGEPCQRAERDSGREHPRAPHRAHLRAPDVRDLVGLARWTINGQSDKRTNGQTGERMRYSHFMTM